mgnify:CR=1 FL=1
MTRTSRHLGLASISLVLLGLMTSAANAGLYINGLKPGGELSNVGWFKPPNLHTNQGGRSHGGNTAIVIINRPGFDLGGLDGGSLIDNAVGPAFETARVKTDLVTGFVSTESDSMSISYSQFTEHGSNGSMNNGNMLPGPGPLVLLLTAGLGMKRRRRRS